MKWLFTHARREKGVRFAPFQPDELVDRVRTRLDGQGSGMTIASAEPFDAFLSDFGRNGQDALERRGLFGYVTDHTFELAPPIAHYMAHHYSIPFIHAWVAPSDGHSLVKYELIYFRLSKLILAVSIWLTCATVMVLGFVNGLDGRFSLAVSLLLTVGPILIIVMATVSTLSVVQIADVMSCYLVEKFDEIVGVPNIG